MSSLAFSCQSHSIFRLSVRSNVKVTNNFSSEGTYWLTICHCIKDHLVVYAILRVYITWHWFALDQCFCMCIFSRLLYVSLCVRVQLIAWEESSPNDPLCLVWNVKLSSLAVTFCVTVCAGRWSAMLTIMSVQRTICWLKECYGNAVHWKLLPSQNSLLFLLLHHCHGVILSPLLLFIWN